MTNILYQPIIFTDFFYGPTIFTDFDFLFCFNFNFTLFSPTTIFGDIPFPFLVVKESKCFKNNNIKSCIKCYMKSGLVNLFAITSYNS